jgi:hypothetical protein
MTIMKPTLMMPKMPTKVPFVMAPIAKRTEAMRRIMITLSLMPLLLLAPQCVVIAMLTITKKLVEVMMISCCYHVQTSPCNQMFLHQTLPHILAHVTIPNGMPAQKSRGTTLGRIHQIVKTSVSVPTNVYLVLVVAVNPLPQSLIHLNQLPSHFLMVLVGKPGLG